MTTHTRQRTDIPLSICFGTLILGPMQLSTAVITAHTLGALRPEVPGTLLAALSPLVLLSVPTLIQSYPHRAYTERVISAGLNARTRLLVASAGLPMLFAAALMPDEALQFSMVVICLALLLAAVSPGAALRFGDPEARQVRTSSQSLPGRDVEPLEIHQALAALRTLRRTLEQDPASMAACAHLTHLEARVQAAFDDPHTRTPQFEAALAELVYAHLNGDAKHMQEQTEQQWRHLQAISTPESP